MADRADVLCGVLADLAGESGWLESVLAGLDGSGWLRPTPAPGWRGSGRR